MPEKSKNRFIEPADTVVFPVCNNCVHFLGGDKCKAFDKIPASILLGENDHSQIMPGQKALLTFKAKD